jgi:cysteine desulfurase/selenocysteine lyase
VHRWARWAHEAGARIVVDAAQLVPHRPVDMRPADDPEHLDFLAFSGHKMYAPFGAGVLIGPRLAFERSAPRLVGGGTVSIVDVDRVQYADAPDREEAGTPAIIGAVAIAAAIREYQALGWTAIMDHEAELARIVMGGLRAIPGVTIYGGDSASADRLAVVPFNIDGLPHALVSAILSEEWGIGTRSGCFCAHPYVKAMLGVSETEARALEARILAGDHSDVPGMVRASFGWSNTFDDAHRLVEAVRAIAGGRFQQCYALGADGEYSHSDSRTDFAEFFTI